EFARLIWRGRARASGARDTPLDAQAHDELAAPAPAAVPDAFAVFATIGARSAEAIRRGDFRLLLTGVAGPSGARLLGRFCHADPALRRFVETHLRAEESLHPKAIFAEIVHLPEGRMGNILARP